MSALPKSDSPFKIGDHVIVKREGADQGMKGVVIVAYTRHDKFLVEFNRVDVQAYREQDLESVDPKAASSTPAS